jgi:hypothetical protein
MNQSTKKTDRTDFYSYFRGTFQYLDIPMGLLNILLIILLVFYAFSLIIKLIFKRKIKKLEHQMSGFNQDETPSANDEMKNPHIDPNIGEYTEFEEVE